ncbi:MAG: hypothetical protein ACRC4N_05000, partial [Gammaproteobacteria bacterium]
QRGLVGLPGMRGERGSMGLPGPAVGLTIISLASCNWLKLCFLFKNMFFIYWLIQISPQYGVFLSRSGSTWKSWN